MDSELERYRYEQSLFYLRELDRIVKRIKTKQDAIADHRGKLMCISGVDYSRDSVQVQSNGDAIPDGVAALLDLIAETVAEIAEYAKMQRQAEQAFEQLPRIEYEQVLKMHYLRGKDWGTIAAELNYSYAHVMTLRRAAIIALYEVMPCEYRDPMHQAV